MIEEPSTTPQAENPPGQPILVAVDFSDDARAAVLLACQFADCMASRLMMLHVVHDPASQPGFYRTEKQDQMQTMQEVASSMMAGFLSEMIKDHPGLDVLKSAKSLLVDGLPPGRIVEIADLHNARLIVIGSRGMTGLPHLMLGSVAERVVELSSRPVVVVKAENRKVKEKQKDKKQKKRDKNRLESESMKQGDADG